MDNTQFLYELQLASLEIATLAGTATIADDFRTFSLPANANTKINTIAQRTAYFSKINGTTSDYSKLVRHNITRSFNQYITHWFYPYKGKFHPQMIRAIANIIGMQPGEVLLDPFVGSGTAAVEGTLLGLSVVGFDISPLCVLIGKVKTNAMHQIAKIEKVAKNDFAECGEVDLSRALRNAVGGFDLLARLISLSDQVRRRRNFSESLQKNRSRMLESIRLMKTACDEVNLTPAIANIRRADARRLPLNDESVDGVITSPPYSIALNYVANDAHALSYLGQDIKKESEKFIGVRGASSKRIALYEQDMQKAYYEIARVLRPGRMAAIVLGNAMVNGMRLPTVKNCEQLFADMGFQCLHKINKTIFGLYNVMQQEDILIFQKPKKPR